MTIIALTCVLVVGAAAASILGRDSVPAAGPAMATASAIIQGPVVSNKEGKERPTGCCRGCAGLVRTGANRRDPD